MSSSQIKTTRTKASVKDFIAAVADEQRRTDSQALVKLMTQATGEKPAMWGASIVGFGSYRYVYASGHSGDWPILGFSPRKNDLTIYIMPGFDQIQEPLARLGKHRTGKSCLYIKRLSDCDPAALQEIIDFAVAQMAQRRITTESSS